VPNGTITNGRVKMIAIGRKVLTPCFAITGILIAVYEEEEVGWVRLENGVYTTCPVSDLVEVEVFNDLPEG
jgi:hypothetical protein